MKNKTKVLMVGPSRKVKGGMTTVVNNYYEYGLDSIVNLTYLESCNDGMIFFKFFKEIQGFLKFRKILKNYDVIHLHMASRRSTFRKSKYVRLAKKMGKKIIIHIHGAEYKIFYSECNTKQKKYVKQTLSMADKIIVLSEEWKDFFKNIVNENKIEIIYNSIVIPCDFKKNINQKKILFLGRIGHRKGIYDLIDVVEKLILKYPDIKLYIGGDGETEIIKNIIRARQLDNNVCFLGWISGEKKEQLLKECSYYVLPSYNEGMPMSVLEGMAYKNITISTYVGGIPKVINHNENGILINPGDKEKLFEEFNRLFEDDKLRIKLSCNARKTIEEKFNIIKIIDKLISIYHSL